MSRTFRQPGDTLDLVAPVGGVTSGTPVKIGAIVAVPIVSAAAGVTFAGAVTGVHELTAEGAGSGQDLAQGDAVYWDDTNKRCTKTAAGNTKIGVAVAAKATAATLVTVRLNAAF